MPPREQGFGCGCGACEAGRTLVTLTSPASGARHQGCMAQLRLIKFSSPAPSVWSGLVLA